MLNCSALATKWNPKRTHFRKWQSLRIFRKPTLLMHSLSKVTCRGLFSGAEEEQNQGGRQGSGKPASSLDSETQIESQAKPGLIARSLNERHEEFEKVNHQSNSRESTSKALMRKGSGPNANNTGHSKGCRAPQRRSTPVTNKLMPCPHWLVILVQSLLKRNWKNIIRYPSGSQWYWYPQFIKCHYAKHFTYITSKLQNNYLGIY